jgi:4'-phosphopantetheinyl transferase
VRSLDPRIVRLRWLATEPPDPACLHRWREMLDPHERARSDRYRFASDRNAFIAAHALLRAMLSGATGLPPPAWRFVTDGLGKPALAPAFSAAGLRFSISHSRGWAACAIAHTDVGVDVESIHDGAVLDVVDRFAPAEVELLRSQPRDQLTRLFTRLWTLKEAFLKATGEGLRRPLDSLSFAVDPVRLAFPPGHPPGPRGDDPAAWTFAEFSPAPTASLSVALRRRGSDPLQVDAQPARPELDT